MDITYKVAWKEGDVALYIDASDRKYAARGGTLAWRINNPGLVRHHSHVAKQNGSIGTWEQFSIFSNPLQGHQALKDWLHSKTIGRSDFYALAKHYEAILSESLAKDLASSIGVSPETKLRDLTPKQMEVLVVTLEKLCGFILNGNEKFELLPKIAAKLECPGKEDLYLVGTELTLTLKEAIDWTHSCRLDAVVVNVEGKQHLRSRQHYRIQTLKFPGAQYPRPAEEPQTLARVVGERIPGQCVWGFINGIGNSKEDALKSSKLISTKAGGEEVISLKNDALWGGLGNAVSALILKVGIDTPVIKEAIQFLKHLLGLAEGLKLNSPVVIFVHSQGAAIIEHALAGLSSQERKKIRVFAFGGWSFISPDAAHPESHNYVSVADIIPRMGSLNLHYLIMKKYEGQQKGWTLEEIVRDIAVSNAIHHLDFSGMHTVEAYTEKLCEHYRAEFEKVSNVTVISSNNTIEHSFGEEVYQKVIQQIVARHQKKV